MTTLGLDDALERTRQEERQRALRALLLRPLLPAHDPAFRLVRRHLDWLREWLAHATGWGLRVEADFARLRKHPGDHADGTRPAFPEQGAAARAFNRRRYVLFCLALAVIERGEGQTALGRLGEQIAAAVDDVAMADANLRFDLGDQASRRDLVAVVRLLLELSILARVAGDEEAYVRESGDVLYDVNRRVLAEVMVCPRGPSLVAADEGDPGSTDGRLDAIHRRPDPDTTEARNRMLRHRLTRRLLDDPVVYYGALSDEEMSYLAGQRAALVGRIREATGLVEEVRAEGIAMVDPANELTDRRMPAEGTEGHATLLLAGRLAQCLGEGAARIGRAEAEAWMREWAVEYGRYWKKAAREPGAENWLVRDALERLYALRLAEPSGDDGICALPAVARYAPGDPELPPQLTLPEAP